MACALPWYRPRKHAGQKPPTFSVAVAAVARAVEAWRVLPFVQ